MLSWTISSLPHETVSLRTEREKKKKKRQGLLEYVSGREYVAWGWSRLKVLMRLDRGSKMRAAGEI